MKRRCIFTSSLTTKTETMNANVKISQGTRVKVTTGIDAGRIGTVQFNKGQQWYVALDGETRPANIVGRDFYYTVQYKKHLELI